MQTYAEYFARIGLVLVPCLRRARRARPTVSPLAIERKESLSSYLEGGCEIALTETRREANALCVPSAMCRQS